MSDRAKAKSEQHLIGKPQRKIDGLAKSTGEARYTDDIALPGMLHGKILRSPHPHARIVSIDLEAALAIPGVHAAISGKDLPVRYGIIPWTPDEYPLCVERVRYIGDGVAAVAAVDEDTANQALEAIRVEYEELPAFLTPEDALGANGSDDAPFIHPARKEGRNGNVTKRVELEFGDVDSALAGSDVTVEGDYFFEGTTHTPIEPHCAIGQFDGTGKLTVWSATQVPHYLHRELARVLDLDPARVRVLQPLVGGAFGGKSEPFDLEFCVAKLAMLTGRPVKILYTREEVFYAHRGRHPFDMHYVTGATRDGMLTGVDARIVLDGGAYASFGLVTTYYSGQLLAAPYHIPAYRFDSTRVYTNKPACGPKRGHGSVQPRFAFEVQLDKLAEKLELDPIEFRRRNFMGAHRRTVNELRVTSNGFLECLEAVERASDWKEKFRKLPMGRGVGVAGSCYISGTNYPIYPNDMPQSAIQIQLDRSGRVAVFSGASEIGQGCDSMVAYVAAEELGVPLEYVRVLRGDTDFTPVDLGAYSSRVTFMLGNACIDAARKLRRKVQEAVAEHWGCRPAQVLLAGGRALYGPDTERQIPVDEAFQLAETRFGTLGATGWYNTPKDVHGDYRGGTIGASPAYSFTAHVAEVEVDEETGVVTVDKIWVAHDCGRALNPVLVEGQMEGSAYMGFAEALMEEHVFKGSEQGRAGLHNAPSLLDYRIPTSLDTPELESLIVESIDPEGPYGAKEAGEGPLHPSIPAIANAIYDAVGVRMDRLPFSAPRVWRALRRGRGVVTGLLLLAALAGCADPVPGADAGPARDTVVYSATPEDASIIRAKVVWGREEGLDTLAVGEAMASLGLTFLGTPYRPGTLEAPGEERVVVNLRELDCVTFVETVAALTELIRDPSVDPEADAARLEARFARALEARRYRGGELDGYPSRLHYFSEWIRDNHERGRVHDLTAELGGDAYPGPVDFMSTHPEAYRQLADPDVLTAVVAMEARESARPRFRIPEDRIQGVEAGIQAGDIIAATSAIEGLDVAHTGIAVRVNGRVHLLHAPLVGEEVQLSAVPLADRIKGIPGQDGIMVARPLDGAGVTRGNGSEPGGTARPTGQED
jgi:4-hydroxybenzoyl-CoA reductase alpha subunit